MDRDLLRRLVESSDLKGLLTFIDGLVSREEWEDLEDLRDRCIEAVDRGKQLWGVAEYADYRLALEAPPANAGRVLREGAGRHTLGPLWEVAASTHTWSELSPHLTARRWRTLVAHERMIRGEAVSESDFDPLVLDAPGRLAPWEPVYAVAEYLPDRAAFPQDELPEMEWVELNASAPVLDADAGAEALFDLVRPWVEESSGRGETRLVAGSGVAAIRALGPHRVRMAPLGLAEAMSLMTWVGSSGGAYGRRRGTPVGRASVWWALAALTGLDEDWPVTPDVLGEAAASLRWWVWDPGDRVTGWNFHLAVEDPEDGLAWSVTAADWR